MLNIIAEPVRVTCSLIIKCVGKCLVSVLYILSFMCYEWKFKTMKECSMKVKSIHEQMWENNNQ